MFTVVVLPAQECAARLIPADVVIEFVMSPTCWCSG